jgi:hypothetical protein
LKRTASKGRGLAVSAAVSAQIETRFQGFPRVAPQPNLIELNTAALAREITAR